MTNHHPDYLGHNEYITDKSGSPYQYFHYSAFGEALVQRDANYGSFQTSYTFNAKEFDGETGLGYYGARYYNPTFSVWLGVDALAGKYPTMTPYCFTANNPVMLVDPDGRWIPGLDDEGNVTLTMEKGDSFETFKAFFENSTENSSEDVLKCAYDSRNDDGVVNLSVEVGGVFAEMKTAFNDAKAAGYPSTQGLLAGTESGKGQNYNCWGSCIALNEGRKLEGSGPGTGVGISFGSEFDEKLKSDYSSTTIDKAVVGRTVLRYADRKTNSSANGHGAVFMGTDRSGNEYVFSKNGWLVTPGIFRKSYVDKIYNGNTVRGLNAGDSGYYSKKRL